MQNSKNQYIALCTIFITMICVPIVFFFSSMQLSGGAETVPLYTSVFIIICGIMSITSKLKNSNNAATKSFPAKPLLVFCSLILVFIITVSYVGFYTTSYFLFILTYLLISGRRDTKNILLAAFSALLFILCIWTIFYKTLTIYTPSGLFF